MYSQQQYEPQPAKRRAAMHKQLDRFPNSHTMSRTTNLQFKELPISIERQPEQEIIDIKSSTSNDDLDDLPDIKEELDDLMVPRSEESLLLQEELCKAEIEYFNAKSAYFAKLSENCKIKRNLMILQSRKLQLEIEKFSHDF